MTACKPKPPSFRLAGFSDTHFVAELLREFYQRAGGIFQVPYDHQSTLASIEQVIQRGVCLVGESSCAGVLFMPFPYSSATMVAQVVFWSFRKPKEAKIFEEMVSLCRKAGASFVAASSLFPGNTIQRLYKKHGLWPAETEHFGRL